MKKIISVLLAMALLCAPCMAFGAESGAQDETAQNAYRLAVAAGISCDVPILDGRNVSRAEFLCAVIDAMKLSDTPVIKESCFFDVNKETELSSALAYAVKLNMISEARFFRPNEDITYAEGCKIIVSALGYDSEAEQSGGWPAGYLTAAERLKINKNMRKGAANAISARDFYIMLRNMLEADMRLTSAVIQSRGGVTARYREEQNILTLIYNWYKVSGILEGNDETFLFDSDVKASDGCVSISGKEYKCDEDYVLGARVFGYAADEDGSQKIKFLENRNTKILKITAENEPRYSSGKLFYTEEGSEKSVSFDNPLAVIYNGKSYTSFKAEDFMIDCGDITLTDSDGNGKFNTAIIMNGFVCTADIVNSEKKMIKDTFLYKEINLSDDVTAVIKDKNEEITLSDIENERAIEVYISKDGKYTEIRLLSASLNGTVTSVGSNEIYIDDKPYSVTEYFKKRFSENIQIGSENSFILTETGKIASVGTAGADDKKLGYAFAYEISKGVESALCVRMFTEAGELVTLKTEESVVFCEGGNETKKTKTELLDYLKSGSGEHLLRYGTNSSGIINYVSVPSSDEKSMGLYDSDRDGQGTLKRYNYVNYNSDEQQTYYKSFGLFVPAYFSIDSDTVIFVVKNKNDVSNESERFSLGTLSEWGNDELIVCSSIEAYNVSESGRAEVLVNVGAASSEECSDTSSHGLVEAISNAIDRNGERAVKLTVCSENKYNSYYIKGDSKLYKKVTDPNNALYLELGDYIRFNANSYNEISALNRDFDLSSEVISHRAANENRELNEYYGELSNVESESFAINIEAYSGCDSVPGLKRGCFVFESRYFWIFDKNEKKVSSLPVSQLSNYMNQGYKIFLKTRYASVKEIVLYK